MRDFDILLVFGYFRSATAFLSIIRFLSRGQRIGVLPIDTDPALKAKTGKAHLLFMRLCRQFGAQEIELGEMVQAKLMVVQQFPYPNDLAATIRKTVRAQQTVGLMTLAMAGIEAHDRFLQQFGVTRVTVPDKGLADYLIAERGAQARYANVEMVEVGLPFRKYPVFAEFSADWIVAAPTLFSFHTEAGKQLFLRDVLKLMAQIPKTDVIAYKPHNGNARDYFTPRLYAEIARLIAWVPNAERLMERSERRLPQALKMHASRIVTALLHARVTRRAVPMVELTPLADMSLEAFLPGVRKGVIGGLSNTTWGTLFYDLSYYNCVSQDDRKGGKSDLLEKNGDALLGMNLKYFGVPYCHGLIERSGERPDIALDLKRHNNIVDLVSRAFKDIYA